MGKFIDMTGWVMAEHGVPDSKWTVIRRGHYNKSRHIKWECKCSCGNPDTFEVVGGALTSGGSKSCGCTKVDCKIKDGRKIRYVYPGSMFDNLEVIERDKAPKTKRSRHNYWICKCKL